MLANRQPYDQLEIARQPVKGLALPAGNAAYLLKRHPMSIKAHFEFSLVLTYAFPAELLTSLLPPGLSLYSYEGWGFLAIAMVQTRKLHPDFLPSVTGQDFFLTGYRIFCNYQTRQGRNLRGLYILRSDTDRQLMKVFGNLLTHYHYSMAKIEWQRQGADLSIAVRTPGGDADLIVCAKQTDVTAPLPPDSPFPDLKVARRFAGPLPFTFDYEKETHSIVRIEGVRQNWQPKPIRVEVAKATFIERFAERFTTDLGPVKPLLANAFYLEDVAYSWKPGVRETLPR